MSGVMNVCSVLRCKSIVSIAVDTVIVIIIEIGAGETYVQEFQTNTKYMSEPAFEVCASAFDRKNGNGNNNGSACLPLHIACRAFAHILRV